MFEGITIGIICEHETRNTLCMSTWGNPNCFPQLLPICAMGKSCLRWILLNVFHLTFDRLVTICFVFKLVIPHGQDCFSQTSPLSLHFVPLCLHLTFPTTAPIHSARTHKCTSNPTSPAAVHFMLNSNQGRTHLDVAHSSLPLHQSGQNSSRLRPRKFSRLRLWKVKLVRIDLPWAISPTHSSDVPLPRLWCLWKWLFWLYVELQTHSVLFSLISFRRTSKYIPLEHYINNIRF